MRDVNTMLININNYMGECGFNDEASRAILINALESISANKIENEIRQRFEQCSFEEILECLKIMSGETVEPAEEKETTKVKAIAKPAKSTKRSTTAKPAKKRSKSAVLPAHT